MKWEYKVVPVTSKVHLERYIAYKEGRKPITDSIQDVMNLLGEVGWELVNVLPIKQTVARTWLPTLNAQKKAEI